jgi:hypothetical protein
MRIGKRFNCKFTKVISRAGEFIPWVNEICNLGIYFVASCKFKRSFSHAKRSFCRAVNAFHCMHGSAMQVVIGHIAFKGEMANFDLSYLRHR